MTISSTTNRVSFSGNGATTAFATGFKFLANTDLTVILVSAAGVETTQTITTDYTVTGAGNDSGGTVTMVTAPASGETLVIVRAQPYTQGLDLVENDPFPSESVEEALDRLTILAQQNRDAQDRALTLSDGDTTGVSLTLPAPVAGEFFRWNAGLTALEGVTLAAAGAVTIPASATDGGIVLFDGTSGSSLKDSTYTITAAGAALIDDTDTTAQRATLSLDATVESKAGAYTALADDRNHVLRFTAAATLSLTAAATLGADWFVYIIADGGDVTVDPDGAEVINGAATLTVADGSSAIVFCTGTAFQAITASSAASFASVAEDILPDADSTRDLGSATKAWAEIYADAILGVGTDTTIKRVGGTNSTPIVEGLAKAWGDMTYSSGTPSALNSLNESSITDVGTGRFDFNYTAAFTTSLHAVTSAPNLSNFIRRRLKSSSACSIEITDAATGGSYEDKACSFACFGDLA